MTRRRRLRALAAVGLAAAAGLFAAGVLLPGSEPAVNAQFDDLQHERQARSAAAESLFAAARAGEPGADYSSAARAALLARDYRLASEIGTAWAADGGGLPALRIAASAEVRFGLPGAAAELLARIGSCCGAAETYRTIAQSAPDHNHNPSLGTERIRLMRAAHPPAERDASFHAHLALLMLQADRTADARQELASALAIDPESYSARFLASLHTLLGHESDRQDLAQLPAAEPGEPAEETMLRLLRWQTANEKANVPLPRAATDVPQSIQIAAPKRLLVAQVLAGIGWLQQALSQAEIAGFGAGHATDIKAFRLRTRLLDALGRSSEIEAVAEQALDAADDASVARLARTATDELARAGSVDAAWRIARSQQRARRQIELLELAGRYGHASGHTAEAAALFDEALAARPDNARMLLAVGFFLADSGSDLARARTLLERADELRPEEPSIQDALGWLAFREGEHAQASRLLQDALDAQPNAEAAARLAQVLWAQGKREESANLLRQAARRSGSSFVVREAAARLGIAGPQQARRTAG